MAGFSSGVQKVHCWILVDLDWKVARSARDDLLFFADFKARKLPASISHCVNYVCHRRRFKNSNLGLQRADHARRLADIERDAAERTATIELELIDKKLSAEKSASDKRMQAELEAVEAGSSRGSNRGSRSIHSTVDQWLEGIPRPLEPAAIFAQEPSQPASFSSAPSHIHISTTAPLSPRAIEHGDIALLHKATTSGIPHVFQAGDAIQAHPQAWGPYGTNVAAPPGPLPTFQEVGVTSAPR
ncbi:hypothetical protein RR46_00108 [Papilio xuthus]|uniref:Uncharacterized protein n=1 Tax=Papilio xuthus TaxID=66420 RepID=A0A0N1I4C9_PAPXU|nr:hypothetical protein RR46_00108 [Papilio xuthus]